MSNEQLIRCLIEGSRRRAILESAAGLIVGAAFGALLVRGKPMSPSYFGCLVILLGTGLIAAVLWYHALGDRTLQRHPAEDVAFWRKSFQSQARLLRWVPLWYCAPLCLGGILLATPVAPSEIAPFSMLLAIFVAIFACVVWLNRRAAAKIEEAGSLLTTS